MKPLFHQLIPACILLLFLYQPAFSQDASAIGGDKSSEVFGNPYLIRDWSEGAVKFSSGRVVNQFKLRFDCVRNQLILQFQGSTFAAESKVKEFVMYTGSGKKKDSLVFRKGYPAVDNATDNTYYHVLVDEKVQLLRLVSKNIIEEKELISSNRAGARGRLEDQEKYYLLKDGGMIYLSADKDDLLKALPEKADALSAFISEKRLRFKSHQDYTLLVSKYVELMQ